MRVGDTAHMPWQWRLLKLGYLWLIRRIEARNAKLEKQLRQAQNQLYGYHRWDPMYAWQEWWIEDLKTRLLEGRVKLNEVQGRYVNIFICKFKVR